MTESARPTTRSLRALGAVVLLAATLVLPNLVSSPARAATATAPTGTVTLVHGLRGLLADVWVDGKKVLSGFAPERVTSPLTIPAGVHDMEVRKSGAAGTSKPAVKVQVAVQPDARLSIAVGLSPSGAPLAQVFDDRTGALTDGKSAIAVRAVAQAPAVRVSVADAALGSMLTSGGQLLHPVNPGSYAIEVLPASGSTPVVPPQQVPVAKGSATALYLIGSAQNNSLGWLAETIPTSATTPTKIQTGDSGLAATRRGGLPMAAIAAIAAAIVGVAGLASWRQVRIAAARRTGPGPSAGSVGTLARVGRPRA